MNVQVIEDRSYQEALVRDWEELLSGSRFQNPFLTPTWNEVWLKHFGKALNPRVILLRDRGGILMALGAFSNSIEEEGRRGLALMGSSDVCDYRDLVVASGREEEAFSALARSFAEGPWEYLELDGISEFSPTIQFLPPIMQSLGFRVSQEVEEIGIYLNLPGTWDEFLKKLNSKDRHELRRKMHRLEKETTFELSRVEDASSLPGKMEIFFDLHRKSRKDKAEFMTSEMEAYFRDLSARFWEKGWLNLSFLKVEGREIAAFISFDFQGAEYIYNSGYDPQFGHFSPGIVLAALCIGRAIEKGMASFNFLRGKEDYKYHLGGKEEKIYRIRVIKK